MTWHNEKLRRPHRIAATIFFVLLGVWFALIFTDGSRTAIKWVWGFEGMALGVGIGIKIADGLIKQSYDKREV